MGHPTPARLDPAELDQYDQARRDYARAVNAHTAELADYHQAVLRRDATQTTYDRALANHQGVLAELELRGCPYLILTPTTGLSLPELRGKLNLLARGYARETVDGLLALLTGP